MASETAPSDDDRLPAASAPALIAVGAARPLPESARRLLDRPLDELGEVDLRDTVVVLPGRRAGRQFLLELDEQAASDGLRVVPPRTATPSGLAALFASADHRAAGAETWLSAIAACLQDPTAGLDGEAGLLPPGAGPLERRSLARRIVEADRAIAAADRGWSEVADMVMEMGGDDARHRAIETLLGAATRRLASVGLQSPEQVAAATIDALAGGIDPPESAPRRLVLLGVVDLSPRLQRLVRAVASRGVEVEVHAIVEPADLPRLDGLGTVTATAWDVDPPVPAIDRIDLEEGVLDEAIAIDERLGELAEPIEGGGRLDPDSVAVVLADEGHGPPLRRELEARGVEVHLASGRPLSATPVARTIERLRDWCAGPDTHRLGDLLGDDILGEAVRLGLGGDSTLGDPEASWLRWSSERMPMPVEGRWWEDARRDADKATLEATDLAVRRLLGPFHPDAAEGGERRPRSAWVTSLLDLVQRLDEAVGPDVIDADARSSVSDAAEAFLELDASLDEPMAATDAIEIFVEAMSTVALADPGRAAALEAIGWLEAPFDPAPRRIVVGMHDAAVPGRIDDPILPDGLRARLGLEHEARRTARDRWVLSTILARDPEARFLLSRRDLAGEPLVPSRLLFATSAGEAGSDAEALAHRVRRVFGEATRRRPDGPAVSSFGRIEPPSPEVAPVPAPDVLSVTAFREFLASPYRFWIRRILRLDAPEPVGRELDHRLFGNVVHDAIEAFGREEMARSEAGRGRTTDVDAVHGAMLDGMDAALARLAGAVESRSAALRLQRRIIERRLRRVAEVEVERARDDWRIHAVEETFTLPFEIPGQEPQTITGRIDRIDRHPTRGWQLLDFKSSDKGEGPDAAHHMRYAGRWRDLQLPLYRWAAPSILDGADADSIATGYFTVCADLDRIGVDPSKRIDDLHDEAMEVVRSIVEAIRDGRFGIDEEDVPPFEGDPISLLMRTTALVSVDGEADA